MEAKLLLFFFLLNLSLSSSLDFHTLLLHSLPKPPPLLHSNLTWAQAQQETAHPEPSPTLTFHLQHLDALAPPHLSPDDLFSLRLKRDAARVDSLSSRARAHRNSTGGISGSIISGLSHGSGEYFTRLGVGTPPKYLYMVLDTGSDVVWLQCSPCRKCYHQIGPIFDPTRSSSYGPISCGARICRQMDEAGCSLRGNRCAYQVSYGDGSFTEGELATETMTFRGIRVPNVALGCGHDNEGLFVGAAGLLGLGRGGLSFPSQTGNRFGLKFSYCFADRFASSKPSSVIFGSRAVSRTAVFTPLITNPVLDTFYYVELVGMSVAGARVPEITAELFKIDSTGDGGVIVDSGTSITRLARPAYIALRNAFRVKAAGLKPVKAFSLFDTCYNLSGKTEVRVPTVVMHFKGADLSLPANNYMIPVDTSGRFCFGFAGTIGGLSIIGNIQQQGFRVIFDVAQRRVGFVPRACG